MRGGNAFSLLWGHYYVTLFSALFTNKQTDIYLELQ